jgi:hypothetical protein
MTLGAACGKLRAMIARPHDSDVPSLGLVLVKALVFWLRHQGVFWLMALPIAGLAAAITYCSKRIRRWSIGAITGAGISCSR